MLMDGSGAYPVIKFNILYIMRSKMQVCGLCRPGLIHGVSPVANQASANCSCR